MKLEGICLDQFKGDKMEEKIENQIEANLLVSIDKALEGLYLTFCFINNKKPSVSEGINFKIRAIESLKELYYTQAMNILNELEKEKNKEEKQQKEGENANGEQ